jgi:hypothetical protein
MNEFWAAVVGAMVGALAGGGVTWLLQHFQSKRENSDRDKALARSLLFKLIRIYSDHEAFRRHVENCRDNAKKNDLEWGWQSFSPVANGPKRVEFSADEMSYLLSLRNYELFNEILSIDVIHTATIEIFEFYAQRRMALTDMMPASMDGTVGSFTLTPEAFAIVAPRAVELNLLINDIENSIDDDAVNAFQALTQFNNAITETIGQEITLDVEAVQAKHAKRDISTDDATA